MSTSLAKCSCSHCDGHLEFDTAYAGARVACPHCGKETLLYIPVTASAPPTPSPAPAPYRPCRSIGLPADRSHRTTNSGTATNCCTAAKHPAAKHESIRASGREGQLDQLHHCLCFLDDASPPPRLSLGIHHSKGGAIAPAAWVCAWAHRAIRDSQVWHQRHSHAGPHRTYSEWAVDRGSLAPPPWRR